MTRGLVIGKFYPPHSGHKYLIDTAQEGCDVLDVLICDNPKYHIPATVRQQWLQEIHPAANILIIPDIGDDDNSEAWAEHTLQFLGYTPDIVFSSEDYGEPWATHMNTAHQMVDRQREQVPVSATKVRGDLLKHWQYVENPVRKDLAIRIAVIGAESTGTTTLSMALAKHYKAPWVPEFGRLYTEALDMAPFTWADSDFIYIARAQQRMEKELAAKSNGLIICDTNATATQLWQDRYMGHISPETARIAANDKVDLYLLTGDEIPFVQDGIRDGEHIRHDMHDQFEQMLREQNVPFVLLRGNHKQRLTTAQQHINSLLKGYSLHGNQSITRTTTAS